ncbi:MAG: polyprenyl diphosphate synthase [Nanoarchaeota archaeon]
MEIEINVFGRVQGVRFRQNAKEIADELGLKGYAENNEDGSATIIAQGKKEELDNFISNLRISPGLSRIDGMSYNFREAKEKYANFEVKIESHFFSDKLKSFVNLGKHLAGIKAGSGEIPVHIAIIPDGNRRWAREQGKEPSFGHYTAGSYEHLMSIFEEARKMKIKYLSIWGFSTENWSRSDIEIKAIFDMILANVDNFRKDAQKYKIRFRHLGRKDRLPAKLSDALETLEEETKNYDNFNVQICLDYGGRDEIIRTINKMIKSGVKKINEKEFSSYLDTDGIPDVDLIIRTAGEKRTSGFMPYQGVYAELYFCDRYFPDFGPKDLRKAVNSFGKRVRRFGGTAKEDLQKAKAHK